MLKPANKADHLHKLGMTTMSKPLQEIEMTIATEVKQGGGGGGTVIIMEGFN